MSSATALVLDVNGDCTQTTVRRTETNKWFFKSRTPLHVYHEPNTIGLVLLSPTKKEHLLASSTKLFTFPLPPPLNAHIYPETLVVVRQNTHTKNLTDITESDFIQLCTELIQTSTKANECVQQTVYDVPAMPIMPPVEDDIDESMYDEEEDDDYETNEDSEEIEDEDWDDEDNGLMDVQVV